MKIANNNLKHRRRERKKWLKKICIEICAFKRQIHLKKDSWMKKCQRNRKRNAFTCDKSWSCCFGYLFMVFMLKLFSILVSLCYIISLVCHVDNFIKMKESVVYILRYKKKKMGFTEQKIESHWERERNEKKTKFSSWTTNLCENNAEENNRKPFTHFHVYVSHCSVFNCMPIHTNRIMSIKYLLYAQNEKIDSFHNHTINKHNRKSRDNEWYTSLYGFIHIHQQNAIKNVFCHKYWNLKSNSRHIHHSNTKKGKRMNFIFLFSRKKKTEMFQHTKIEFHVIIFLLINAQLRMNEWDCVLYVLCDSDYFRTYHII